MLDDRLSDESIDKALGYVESTSKRYAEVKAQLEALKDMTKSLHAFAFSSLPPDMPVGTKNVQAYKEENYLDHLKKLDVCRLELFNLQVTREVCFCKIEMWRTYSSNNRKGMI